MKCFWLEEVFKTFDREIAILINFCINSLSRHISKYHKVINKDTLDILCPANYYI